MTNSTLPFVQRDEVVLTEITSTLTGRTVRVNPCTHQFLVLPGWDPQRLARAEEMCRRFILERATVKRMRHEASANLKTLRPLFAATTRDAFADELERLVGQMHFHAWEGSAVMRRLEPVNPHVRFRPAIRARRLEYVASGALLVSLWKQELILHPLSEANNPRLLGLSGLKNYCTPEVFGDMVREVGLAVGSLAPTPIRHVTPKLWHLVMTTSEASSLADLDEQALMLLRPLFASSGEYAVMGAHWANSTHLILDAMHRAHKTACANSPTALAKLPSSYRSIRPKPTHKNARHRGDPTFSWISQAFPQFAAWQPVATAHLGSITGRMDMRTEVASLASALTALFQQPETPATPLAMCVASGLGRRLMRQWLDGQGHAAQAVATRLRVVSQFFAFVIDQAASADGVPDPRYRNPTTGLKAKRWGHKAQTDRIPMPPWLMREIHNVLFDKDETWARSVEGDYFIHVDPVSGLSSKEFSPVRLEFFRLRFLLPFRSLQGRLLDSGEGDTERWEAPEDAPLNGQWVPNTGPWAPPAGGKRREYGLLQKMYDHDNARFLTGLYISTNKTADKDDFGAPGYAIPWESAEIIALATRLRRWQEAFNPSRGPQKRTVILKKGFVSADVETKLPGLHWLFRDAATPGEEHLPLDRSRMTNYWLLLLAHIEEQMAERVRAGDPSARPVQLVTKRARAGYPQKVAFDQHTIRVTGATQLKMAGCPISVLSALMGHATWIMTWYYVKPSAADFKKEMGAATERALTEMDAATWESLMADDSHAQWHDLTVCNDDIAKQYASDVAQEFWRTMDYGVCPAGGGLCHIGGEQIGGNARDGYAYGPVRGGSKNCTSCRFFLTGPAKLGGLNARYHALQLEVVIAGERLRDAEEASRKLLIATASDATPATPTRILATSRRQARADAAIEEATEAVVTKSLMLNSTLLLHERCKKVLPSTDSTNAQTGDGQESRLPMIAVGTLQDLQFALTQCTEFDLWSRICEESEVYFGNDATNAAMRRALRFDKILAESDRPALFAYLSRDQLISVGNQYGRWLRTTLGEADARAVVEGRQTLAELGLLDESDAFLAQHRCGIIVAPPVVTGQGAPRLLPAAT